MNATTWIVVLDRSRAVFLEKDAGSGAPFAVREIDNPEGKVRGHDLVGDRPGRSFDSHTGAHRGQTGGPRHSLSSEVPVHEQAMRRLNHEVAEFLARARNDGRYDRLVLIGDPHILGDLHGDLDEATKAKVAREIHKDFAHRSGAGLLRVVEHELSAQE